MCRVGSGAKVALKIHLQCEVSWESRAHASAVSDDEYNPQACLRADLHARDDVQECQSKRKKVNKGTSAYT